MTSLRLIVIAVLVAVNIPALAQQPSKAAAQAIRPMPSAVAAQHARIQRLLPLATKHKIELLVPVFREEAMSLPSQTDFEKLAASDVHKNFPHVSAQQADVLVFTLLEQTADSMSDTSEVSQLQLQMTMDRRSKLIETLSNIMKTIAETSDSIVQNLK
jgi:hypothetical protein